jgi:hypothetical protein
VADRQVHGHRHNTSDGEVAGSLRSLRLGTGAIARGPGNCHLARSPRCPAWQRFG